MPTIKCPWHNHQGRLTCMTDNSRCLPSGDAQPRTYSLCTVGKNCTINPVFVGHALQEYHVYNVSLIVNVLCATQNSKSALTVHVFKRCTPAMQHSQCQCGRTLVISEFMVLTTVGTSCLLSNTHCECAFETQNVKSALMVHVLWEAQPYNPAPMVQVLQEAHTYNTSLQVHILQKFVP